MKTDGEWHHVAATYDGTSASLYLDGSIVASSAFAGDVGDSSTWRIGAYGATPTGFYGGTIDDVRIYDRALGADQIASTMQG